MSKKSIQKLIVKINFLKNHFKIYNNNIILFQAIGRLVQFFGNIIHIIIFIYLNDQSIDKLLS